MPKILKRVGENKTNNIMNEIKVFKSSIMDGGKQVGSMMIIRWEFFALNIDSNEANAYFKNLVGEIADKEFKNSYSKFYPLDFQDYRIAVVIEGINDLPFMAYPLVN